MNEALKELEKSMRRVEIKKLWQLKNSGICLSEMLKLSFSFMAHAMESCDYRFLNTALKLNDRLRSEYPSIKELPKIEEYECYCLETVKNRLGI